MNVDMIYISLLILKGHQNPHGGFLMEGVVATSTALSGLGSESQSTTATDADSNDGDEEDGTDKTTEQPPQPLV